MRDIAQQFIDLLIERRAKGIATYGVPIDPDAESVEFWLKSMVEETADASQYGMAALECVQKLRQEVADLKEENADLRRRLLPFELQQAMKDDVATLHKIIHQRSEGAD